MLRDNSWNIGHCDYSVALDILFVCISVATQPFVMAEFSPEEGQRLIDSFQELGVKPKCDSTKDLEEWMLAYLSNKGVVPPKVEPKVTTSSQHTTTTVTQYPKLVPFSGEGGKGETSYDLWKYDLQCLLEERIHSHESIRQALRNSLRGRAARTAKMLGTSATIDDIVHKLDCIYGTVEIGENLLSEFYSASQRGDEDVAAWSCRLEELLAKAAEQTRIDVADRDKMLKAKFWAGLHQDLKDSSRYKKEAARDFDELRIAIRAIEHEHSLSSMKKPHVLMVQQQHTDLKELCQEMRSEMKSFREELHALKSAQSKHTSSSTNQPSKQWNKRGSEAAPSHSSVVRSTPSSQPPVRQCWRCGRQNHIQRNCRAIKDIDGNTLN